MNSSTLAKFLLAATAISETATRKVAEAKTALKPKVLNTSDDIIKLLDAEELEQFKVMRFLDNKVEGLKILSDAVEKALKNRTIDSMSTEVLAFLMQSRAKATAKTSDVQAADSTVKTEQAVTSKPKETISTDLEGDFEKIALLRQIEELKGKIATKDSTIYSLKVLIKQIRRKQLFDLQEVIGRVNGLSSELSEQLGKNSDNFLLVYPEDSSIDPCTLVTEG